MQAVIDTITTSSSDQELKAALTSLEESRAEWSKLNEAVKQCVKDLKAEDLSQKSLAKKLQKKDVKRKEVDVRAAAEEQESQKKARLSGLFACAALTEGLCLEFGNDNASLKALEGRRQPEHDSPSGSARSKRLLVII